MLAIACGYEDADDLDHLRTDPGFKLACGNLPESGGALCSQPTMSRWENAPTLREVVRLTYALVDIYCASYARPPAAVTLDIDDTVDVAHGHQQMSLFNAHYDERCFLPIHVYDTERSRPVAVLLRPGKTPSGVEVRNHLRRLVRRIRGHWPNTRLTIRSDSHYGRVEVMAWCEANGVDYIFGLYLLTAIYLTGEFLVRTSIRPRLFSDGLDRETMERRLFARLISLEPSMTPLRQRMSEDMQLRNLALNTQRSYLEQISRFARHFGNSPDLLGPEEIRAYQLHLTQDKRLSPSSVLVAVAAIRFLYKTTLEREWNIDEAIPACRKPQKLPVVLRA